MNFRLTGLSGIIEIPGKCTEVFNCSGCMNVTDFYGWAKNMGVAFTGLKGEVTIPFGCTKSFYCAECPEVTKINYA